jgi:VWFA-related protein
MTRVAGAIGLAAMLLATTSAAPKQQEQRTFRSVTSAVTVDVSVTDDRRAVLDLGAIDFQLFDNGVLQDIAASSLEKLPFDLTLVVDTSGSLEGKPFEQFKSDVETIAGMLGADDRFRLVTFATHAADAFGWQPGSAPLPLARIAAGGATSFYQALAATLLRPTEPGRRQLIVAMSDGLDNVSLIDGPDVRELARRADAVLHIVIRRTPLSRSWGWVPYGGGGATKALRDAAELTGGRLQEADAKESLTSAFRRALDEFRTSYVLWYTPTGVGPTGWHAIDVRLKQGKYTVRARSGYDAGSER